MAAPAAPRWRVDQIEQGAVQAQLGHDQAARLPSRSNAPGAARTATGPRRRTRGQPETEERRRARSTATSRRNRWISSISIGSHPVPAAVGGDRAGPVACRAAGWDSQRWPFEYHRAGIAAHQDGVLASTSLATRGRPATRAGAAPQAPSIALPVRGGDGAAAAAQPDRVAPRRAGCGSGGHPPDQRGPRPGRPSASPAAGHSRRHRRGSGRREIEEAMPSGRR